MLRAFLPVSILVLFLMPVLAQMKARHAACS